MIMIYSPDSIPRNLEEDLEKALSKDGARITYIGNDGAEEFVIVEAEAFKHTKRLHLAKKLGLVFHSRNKV